MGIKTTRRGPQGKESSVFDRLGAGRGGHLNNSSNKICKFWLSGRCLKNPCRFAHSEIPDVATIHRPRQTPYYPRSSNALVSNTWRRAPRNSQKAVNGIALPQRCNKLCSGSSHGTIRLWDSHTGQCANVINLGGEVGSVCSEGPWLFVGMPNVVKVWNTESGAEYSLNGPVGQVNAMESVYNLLFAGVEDGVILAWKGTYETNHIFQLAATLKGHTHGITSLVVGGGNRLYSGSKDHTIRVWDHENCQCIMTLNGHNDVVKSLMCWYKYLFSGSLDCMVKVWASADDGSLVVICTHSEEQGILALAGMTDPDVKPILYCSCSDKSVHLYELPIFTDRGRLFAKQEVQTLQIGPGGLFSTGDQTGLLTVYTWLAD
ncbi:hypothetical protein ACB098_11G037500 [Castanea mollissima]